MQNVLQLFITSCLQKVYVRMIVVYKVKPDVMLQHVCKFFLRSYIKKDLAFCKHSL